MLVRIFGWRGFWTGMPHRILAGGARGNRSAGDGRSTERIVTTCQVILGDARTPAEEEQCL